MTHQTRLPTQISQQNAGTLAPVLENEGYCPCCCQAVTFRAEHEWLRDNYLCLSCGSIPRERALMATLDALFPNWHELDIHESSPLNRGASERLRRECQGYVATQYRPGQPAGSTVGGSLNENLEALTFVDASFDLVVTQDVMEHILDPGAAFREIARTLRPGGAHVFTTPLVNKHRPSEIRARRRPDGEIDHVHPPEYHGNPIDPGGSLVTMHWGYDIARVIHRHTGLFSMIAYLNDLERGIRGEYCEVIVTYR